MDQIKAKNVKAMDTVEDFGGINLQPSTMRKESEPAALDDWEMALAGGGEVVVCW